MSEPPPPQEPGKRSAREDALTVVRRLREAGQVAYFAGGCVRDQLLGLEPKDYDVATDAPPTRVRELFPNTQAVGAAFGVILVRQRRSQIEVATFRTDGKYVDGRRPEAVVFTTAEEDAKRRDFTINGMFFDPVEERVIDYVGGQADLKSRLIRAIGEPGHRFEEDHLRLLRAVRFAARFEFEIEPVTGAAINAHASQLKRISPERIADELRRTLTLPPQCSDWAWVALFQLFPGLADVIFRFLAPPPPSLPRNKHTSVHASLPGERTFGLALAAASLDFLIAGQDQVSVEGLLERQSVQKIVQSARQSLRISNDESEELAGTLEGVNLLLRHHPPLVATAKRFLARPTAPRSRALMFALRCYLGHARVREVEDMLKGLETTDFAPAPLVTGDDLTAAGLQPGPVFKRVLDAVYDAQLEGRVTAKAEALQLALNLTGMSS